MPAVAILRLLADASTCLHTLVMTDDLFARLMTFPNVLVTGHQAFLTDHALTGIAETTIESLGEYERTGRCTHAVTSAAVLG